MKINSRNECFGLLGVNGAGKTSMFKMLTGEESITIGDVYIEGISVKNNLNQANRRLGFCPQFDAVLDDFTVYETLRIFALIHGFRRAKIQKMIMNLADELKLGKYLNDTVKNLSGGNKRKLSIALVRN
jgi:ATP-binding cassette, subfamily A (ABC1), member 3